MLAHKFVKCLEIPKGEFYSSSFSDEKKLIISDDFILKYHKIFTGPMMYTQSLDRPMKGLDYYGITIIDTTASKELVNELLKIQSDIDECNKLITLLQEAIAENMYVIHFGI